MNEFPRIDAVYRGTRVLRRSKSGHEYNAAHVTVNDKKLSNRYNEVSHSSDFEWGFLGSGPSQLAYAILRDFLGNRRKATLLHQAFKAEIILQLKQKSDWVLTGRQILNTITVQESIVRDVQES